MTGFRLPLRLARREVRRRPGRTALVALLVALPVAGMLLASVTIHTGNHSSLEGWVRSNGQAEAVSYSLDTDAPELPTGSRLVEVTSTYLRARTADGLRSEIQLSDLPLQDPIAVGIHELVEGRTPTAGGEVVLASRLAHRLHVSVGDDLVLVRPALTLRLVGRIDPIGCLSCPSAVVAPGQIPAAVLERDGAGRMGLIDLPTLSAGARDALVASGQVELRNLRDLGPVDDSRSVQWSLVLGAIALTVLGIVISAAFAVGARRQLVTLGQLSASGAPPSTVRAALVLQGTVTGVLGGLLGLAIAGTALLAGRGLFERLLDERIYAYVVSGKDVVLAVAIGVVESTMARVRLTHIPTLLVTACLLSAFGILTLVR